MEAVPPPVIAMFMEAIVMVTFPPLSDTVIEPLMPSELYSVGLERPLELVAKK